MLTTTQLQAQGATAPGVDAYLQEEAKKAGKKVAGLETMQQHLAVLTELNNSGAETLIKSTMEDLTDSSEDFDAMRKAWRSGDLQQLEHLYLDDLKSYPAIYQGLIVKRNNAWVKQLVQARYQHPVFVVVGALHLAGNDGLIAAACNSKDIRVTKVQGKLMKHAPYQLSPVTPEQSAYLHNWFDSQPELDQWGGEGFSFPIRALQFLQQLYFPGTKVIGFINTDSVSPLASSATVLNATIWPVYWCIRNNQRSGP